MTIKRRDKREPMPLEVIEYLSHVVAALNENSFDKFPIGCESYMETEQKRYSSITLQDVRAGVAKTMAQKREYFTSDYRHELTPEHALVCRLLGSTVQMNWLIAEAEKEQAA